MSDQTHRDLLESINKTLNWERLKTLVFRLDVDFDNLAGETKVAKARELILQIKRTGRLPDLVEALADLDADFTHGLAGYLQWVLSITEQIDLQGIPLPISREGQRIIPRLPLDRVHVQLRAIRDERQHEAEETKRQEIERRAKELAGEYVNRESPTSRYDQRHLTKSFSEHLSNLHAVTQEHAEASVDPEVALKQSGRLVVLGSPGAGKSTLLRFLARRAAVDENGPIPILIKLSQYAAQFTQNSDLTQFFLKNIHDDQQRTVLEQCIDGGRVLWLLDGLDEVRENYSEVLTRLLNLSGQMVLTSRPFGDSDVLAQLPHFHLLPLTTDDIDAFLDNWFDALADAQGLSSDWAIKRAVATKTRLADQPSLRPLLNNPLMLTFLVVLAGKEPTEELPLHRAGVYKRYIDELLTSWEEAHRQESNDRELSVGSLRGEPARHTLREGLLSLGWWLHLTYYGGRAGRPPVKAEAAEALTSYFNNSPTFDGSPRSEVHQAAWGVLDFWRNAGLLDDWTLGRGDSEIKCLAFRHLTFEEYAVAVGLSRQWRDDEVRTWDFLRPRLHHRRWLEPILLLATLISREDEVAATNLVRRIWRARSPYEKELRRDLFLAGQCLVSAVEVESSIRQEILKEVLTLYLDCLSAQVTLSWLSHHLSPYSLRPIPDPLADQAKRLLMNSSKKDRTFIEEVLLTTASGGQRSRWHRIRQRETDALLRQSATKALGELRIQSPKAREELLLLLHDSTVGAEAVEALGIIGRGTDEEINALIQLLYDRDNDWRNHEAISKTLGLLVQRTPQLSGTLINAIDTQPRLRYFLISAIFKAAEIVPESFDYIRSCYAKVYSDNRAGVFDEATWDALQAGKGLFRYPALPIIENYLQFVKENQEPSTFYPFGFSDLAKDATVVRYQVQESEGNFVVRGKDLTNELIEVFKSKSITWYPDFALSDIPNALIRSALHDQKLVERLIRLVLQMDGWILARYIELGVDSTNLESQGLLLESVQRLRTSEESIRSSEIGLWVDTCSGASFNPARYIQASKASILGRFYRIACNAYFEAADNLNWDLLRQFKPVVFAALACFRQWENWDFDTREAFETLSTEEQQENITKAAHQALTILESGSQAAIDVAQSLATQRPLQLSQPHSPHVAAACVLAQFAADNPANEAILQDLFHYIEHNEHHLAHLIPTLGLSPYCSAETLELLLGFLRRGDPIEYPASRTLSVLEKPNPAACSLLLKSYKDLGTSERLSALKILETAEQTTDELLGLLTRLLNSRDTEERSAAAEALAKLGEGYKVKERLLKIVDNTPGAVSALVSVAEELAATEGIDKLIQLRAIAAALHRVLRSSVYPYFRVARATGEMSYEPFEAFSHVANLLVEAEVEVWSEPQPNFAISNF